MKVLILGGTRFVGRHLVDALRARDHEVTLFNRGTTEPSKHVENIHGDRNRDLAKLRGRHWDAVIDTCGYLTRSVETSAKELSDSVDRYVFISSISAYADLSVSGLDENSRLASLTTEQIEKANAIDASGQSSAFTYGEMYGGLKALCEQTLEDALPGRVLVVRPGLIVGPYDYTDRFTYWPVRVARGGEVLAPGRPDRFVQFIDARDLAEWIIRMIENQKTGVFNVISPPDTLTMGKFLDGCKDACGSDASFTWVTDDFLAREKVAPWSELPLWLPDVGKEHLKGLMSVSSERAVNAGLSFRPLAETVSDTLLWWKSNPGELKAGIKADREQALLQQWHRAN